MRSVAVELRAAGLTEDVLADDLDERIRQVEAVAEAIPAFQAAQFAREWYGQHHGRLAIEAFEELREQLVPVLDAARGLGRVDLRLPSRAASRTRRTR